jgi:sec-independent protein translocase protein TatA
MLSLNPVFLVDREEEMFGIEDIILILVVALLLFGPNKLPEMARSLGKATGEFKKA